MKRYTVMIDKKDGGYKEVDTNDLGHAERVAAKHKRISLYVEIVDNHEEAAQ